MKELDMLSPPTGDDMEAGDVGFMASTPSVVSVMDEFSTGANRNISTNKLDYEGFISPLVLKRYAEFMHKNRHLPNGTMRNSDNWQLGIPLDNYMKSLARHEQDVRLHHDGYGEEAEEDIETALCAVIFNASGYLFELLKAKKNG